MLTRWVLVVEFHDTTLGIGKIFGQESTVVKWNYQILSLHPVTVRQKVQILDFQSEISVSKIIRIFIKKIHWKYHFRGPFLLLTSIFKALFYWNCAHLLSADIRVLVAKEQFWDMTYLIWWHISYSKFLYFQIIILIGTGHG